MAENLAGFGVIAPLAPPILLRDDRLLAHEEQVKRPVRVPRLAQGEFQRAALSAHRAEDRLAHGVRGAGRQRMRRVRARGQGRPAGDR